MHEDTVKEVYADLLECRAMINSPVSRDSILLRVIDNVLKLTTISEPEQEQAFRHTESAVEVAASAVGPCKHKVVTVYGKCKDCGECLHTNVKNGTCLTCDKVITAG